MEEKKEKINDTSKVRSARRRSMPKKTYGKKEISTVKEENVESKVKKENKRVGRKSVEKQERNEKKVDNKRKTNQKENLNTTKETALKEIPKNRALNSITEKIRYKK